MDFTAEQIAEALVSVSSEATELGKLPDNEMLSPSHEQISLGLANEHDASLSPGSISLCAEVSLQ